MCAQLCLKYDDLTVFEYGLRGGPHEELAVILTDRTEKMVLLTNAVDMRVLEVNPGVQSCDDGKTWPPLWSGEERPAGYDSVPVEDLLPNDTETETIRQFCLKFGLPYLSAMRWGNQRRPRKRRRMLPWEALLTDDPRAHVLARKNRVRCLIEDRRWPKPVKDGVWDIVWERLKPREAAAKTGVCPKRLSNCARTIKRMLDAVPS